MDNDGTDLRERVRKLRQIRSSAAVDMHRKRLPLDRVLQGDEGSASLDQAGQSLTKILDEMSGLHRRR